MKECLFINQAFIWLKNFQKKITNETSNEKLLKDFFFYMILRFSDVEKN